MWTISRGETSRQTGVMEADSGAPASASVIARCTGKYFENVSSKMHRAINYMRYVMRDVIFFFILIRALILFASHISSSKMGDCHIRVTPKFHVFETKNHVFFG